MRTFLLSKLFLLLILLFSCGQNSQYEKAIDYFYPLEKGKTYVYRSYHPEGFTMERKIADIITKKNIKIVKIIETIKDTHGIKGHNYYTLEIKDNVIKGRRGKSHKEEGILLKGPIKIGTKWKVKGYKIEVGRLEETKQKFEECPPGNKKLENFRVEKGKKTKQKIEVRIVGFKEMDVFGKKRRCIIVKTYFRADSLVYPITSIWCKGIGLVEDISPDKAILRKIERIE